MTVPIEITDPALVRAYAHPLRRQILGLLDNRTASPSQIAAELGAPLSNTSYHVRQLAALGLVELVSRTARRGAIEHHYTARVRPTTTDEAWAQLPEIVKRSVIDGWLQQTISHVLAGAEAGGFNLDDTHHTRTTGPLDDQGWKIVSRELARTLKAVEEAVEASRTRIAETPDAQHPESTIVLMHFGTPAPETVAERRRAERPRVHAEGRAAPELQLDEEPPARRG